MEKKDKIETIETYLNFIGDKVLIHEVLLKNHVTAMERNLIAMHKLVDILKTISFDINVIRECIDERM